jgi:F-type H+-transporting ATPase subunit epsilon
VIVLADSAERAEEIDVARAEAARQRAQEAMRRYGERPEGVAARQALRRSRARLRAARRALSRRRM